MLLTKASNGLCSWLMLTQYQCNEVGLAFCKSQQHTA